MSYFKDVTSIKFEGKNSKIHLLSSITTRMNWLADRGWKIS